MPVHVPVALESRWLGTGGSNARNPGTVGRGSAIPPRDVIAQGLEDVATPTLVLVELVDGEQHHRTVALAALPDASLGPEHACQRGLDFDASRFLRRRRARKAQ